MLFVGLLPALISAVPTSPSSEAAPAVKVRQLRSKLSKVLEHASSLPADLTAEARHVDSDAAKALQGSSKSDFDKVISEFAAFTAHLTGKSAALRHAAPAPQLPAEALKKAAELVPTLEQKVRKVLEHLKADKGQSAEQALLISNMERALAAPGNGQAIFEKAVALHKALEGAHGFLATRTQELTADRERLTQQIEEQQAYILYMMLRQRRKLPVKAQMALLRRHQFKDFSYAQKLLKVHSEKEPLDIQLLGMLPKPLAQKLARKDGGAAAGHLAAAGSDGRVQIVSSRLKNAVQGMAAELAKAKVQLEQIAHGSSKDVSPSEKKQAEVILKELKEVLNKVTSTHDLSTQMAAMDEVQNKIKTWMLSAMKNK
jgi:hypothetical protein